MGTSLSGLTPATTFDGLLKVGDNDPLTAELKAISTGDGTDTILSLSDSALSIGGTLDLNFAGQTNVPMQFYGAGAQAHYISGGNDLEIDYVTTKINENVRMAFVANRGVSIGTSNSLTAKLGIKGGGTTSATTSLLVQNSAGTDLLKVQDDGIIGSQYLTLNGSAISPLISQEGNVGKAIRLGNEGYFSSFNYLELKTWDGTSYSPVIRVTGNTTQNVGIGETTPTARLHVKGSGNNNTTTSLLVQNSDGDDSLYVKDALEWGIGHGSANRIDGNNNNLYIRHNQLFFMTGGNYFAKLTTAGFQVGNGAGTPTARLQVKGSGTTSATTALLVQNSGGGNIIKANDDGRVLLGVNTNYQNHLLELNGEGLGDSQTLLRLQSSVNFTGAYTGIGFTNSTNGSSLSSEIRAYRESYGNAMTFNFAGTEMLRATSEGSLGIGETTPTARLQVKGSGTTSATSSLLVQNSAGTELFKVQDDGIVSFTNLEINGTTISRAVSQSISINSLQNIHINRDAHIFKTSDGGAYSEVMRIIGFPNQFVGIGESEPTARLQVKGSGNDATTTALLVQNSDGDELLKVDDAGATYLNGLTYINNQDYVFGNSSFSTGNTLKAQGSMIVGDGANPTSTLQVVGSGTTSATTALLVENSAGTELLKVRDDGWIDGVSTLNALSVRIGYNIQTNGANFKVDHTNSYLQSQYTNNVFGGTNTDGDASALVTMKSTTQGFLPPRMRTGEKNAITSPAPGLMVYDTDANQMSYWNGGGWINF